MQFTGYRLIILLTVAALSHSTGAAAYQANRQEVISSEEATQAADRCGPGWYWEQAGYAPHGKFRAAHCARRW
jgi:hypothetical protein